MIHGLLAFLLLAAAPQEPPPARPGAITLTPAVVDFGMLRPKEEVETVLTLTNGTDHVLFIEKIEGGCPTCMSFDYDGNELAAGGSKEIRVKLTADTRGSRSFHVVVDLTDREQPQVDAHLRYVLRPVLDVTPGAVDFGECIVGEEVVEEVQVHCQLPASLADFAVAPVLEGEGPVRCVVGEPARTHLTDLVDQWALTVTLTARGEEAGQAPFAMRLVFPAGLAEQVVVPVEGRIVKQRFLQQNRLHLGILTVGQERKRSFSIPFTSDEDVTVEGVTSNNEILVAEARIKPGTRILHLLIKVKPTEHGDFHGVVSVRTSHREEPYPVFISGRARRARGGDQP